MEKKDYSSTDSNYPEIVASDIIANIYNEDYKRYVSDEDAISLYDLLGFMDLDRANTIYNIQTFPFAFCGNYWYIINPNMGIIMHISCDYNIENIFFCISRIY